MSLPLRHALPPAVLAYRCDRCGTPCSDGGHGPGALVGEDAVYAYEPGPWLCVRHNREAWTVYLRAKRDRLALIRVSAWLGYPARMADVQRFRRAGEQLDLLGAL